MDKTTYEKYLEENGSLVYREVGLSMLPLIRQGRDFFVVKKKTKARCKKYDVVLYKRKDEYLLHRIVDVRKQTYAIRGDNCIDREYRVCEDDIIGVMTCFIRKGREYSVESFWYKVYSRLWTDLYFLRRIYNRFFCK